MSTKRRDRWIWEWRDASGNAIFLEEGSDRGADGGRQENPGGVARLNDRQKILRLAAECLLCDRFESSHPEAGDGAVCRY